MPLSIDECCEFPLNGMWTPKEKVVGLTVLTKINESPCPLYMGGTVDGCGVPSAINHLISLNRLSSYSGLHRLKTYASVEMFDIEGQLPDSSLIRSLAGLVNSCLKEGPTAVVCYAGLNRSGLITGAALIEQGMEPQEAINLLRSQRNPAVLYNKTFEQFLLNYEA